MACPHGRRRGHCRICRMDRLERDYGVPEDHIDSTDDDGEASQKKAKRGDSA